MSKVGKILGGIFLAIVIFLVGAFFLNVAFWSGALNFLFPSEIATYSSPDEEYSLVFEQMGSPGWPFGPADVRLTLKGDKGKVIKRVSTWVHNDGGSADEWNIKSIDWNEDAVVIILQGAEMEDTEVSIPYKK